MYKIKTYKLRSQIIRRTLLHPLILAQLYLIGVMVLYNFGPWEWPTRQPAVFYLLILLFQIFFCLGYFLSINNVESRIKNFNTVSLRKFLSIMIVVNLIYVIINFFHTVGLSSFSISGIVDSFFNGLTNPSAQYRLKFTAEKFGGQYFTYFSVIFAPIIWSVFPLSFYNFDKMKFKYRIIFLFTLFFEIARWVAIGTSKGVIDLIMILIVVILAKHIQRQLSENYKKPSVLRKYGFRIIVLMLLLSGVLFFSHNVGDRVNQNWSNYSISNGNVSINFESPLMIITPSSLKPTLIYLTSYLTQGYYAFSLSLDLDFNPMFGVGNSMFLMENFGGILSSNLYENTYQNRMSIFNWHPYSNWHSFYVWVANDVHYLGVIIAMFLMGYLFGSTYKNVILNNDPIALVLFCLVTIMIIYIPANNQILSYPTTFMAFWILLIYWYFRKKYRFVFIKEVYVSGGE